MGGRSCYGSSAKQGAGPGGSSYQTSLKLKGRRSRPDRYGSLLRRVLFPFSQSAIPINIQGHYKKARKENRKVQIKVWTDFDLYHRNDKHCADHYLDKPSGIPDFLFSFHNFEDFYALHMDGDRLNQWLQFGAKGHFNNPLHSKDYLPEIQRIFPNYAKGELPVDFITWDSLKNLKSNLTHQPSSNPQGLKDVQSFAAFLIDAIERAFPNALQ